MSERLYIVTLHDRRDLENFYDEMEHTGSRNHLPTREVRVARRRPISRNTMYWLTDEEAEALRQDERVWAVDLTPEEKGLTLDRYYTPYVMNGTFWKAGGVAPEFLDWAKLHCAGDIAQRQKNVWGSDTATQTVNDACTIFGDGSNVDIIIGDDVVGSNANEYDDDQGNSRFVQYDWFGNLNSLVGSIDDDGETLPTGTYTYTTTANSDYHGTHVMGTAGGIKYGWAKNANLYNYDVFTYPALLVFDYIRAFHRSKSVNPNTGIKNPTVCNHSWGYNYTVSDLSTNGFNNLNSIFYRGTTYDAGNPGPSGWSRQGIKDDFGFNFDAGNGRIPAVFAALDADVEDAIEEGIVTIVAAGNSNWYMVDDGHPDYNNTFNYSGLGSAIPLHRGTSPSSSPSCIRVGALSANADNRRASYSNYGPQITIWAPGTQIVSCFNSQGFNDTSPGRVTGVDYYYPIQGTSMAAPQVCGVLACYAEGKQRFTNSDAKQVLREAALEGDITWNQGLGGGAAGSYGDITAQKESANIELRANTGRKTSGDVTRLQGERTQGQTYPRPKIYQQEGS